MALTNLTKGTVVGSEGGSATTNLAQGLAKAWADYSGSGTTFTDSFNCASATDNGTGDYTITITNDMASGNFSLTGNLGASQAGDEHTLTFLSTDTSAGSRRIFSSTNYEPGSANGTPRDNIVNAVFHGDLA
tara:strand:+ start:18632 stop:19027 length:396 start_codon:yes stop_codon:yes gene_type:complete